MARKKVKPEPQEAEPVVIINECGNCESAYGYCVNGYGGLPVFCRCPKHKGHVLLLSHKACVDFKQRTEPIPKSFPYLFSQERI